MVNEIKTEKRILLVCWYKYHAENRIYVDFIAMICYNNPYSVGLMYQ